MPKLPLVDLHAQYASIKPEVDAAMQAVVDSAAFVGGPAVRESHRGLEADAGIGAGDQADATGEVDC